MAIGTARALGFDFPRNFNCPYIARSPADRPRARVRRRQHLGRRLL